MIISWSLFEKLLVEVLTMVTDRWTFQRSQHSKADSYMEVSGPNTSNGNKEKDNYILLFNHLSYVETRGLKYPKDDFFWLHDYALVMEESS